MLIDESPLQNLLQISRLITDVAVITICFLFLYYHLVSTESSVNTLLSGKLSDIIYC